MLTNSKTMNLYDYVLTLTQYFGKKSQKFNVYMVGVNPVSVALCAGNHLHQWGHGLILVLIYKPTLTI